MVNSSEKFHINFQSNRTNFAIQNHSPKKFSFFFTQALCDSHGICLENHVIKFGSSLNFFKRAIGTTLFCFA